MKKRVIIIILIIVLLIILWLGMVFTDYFRCSNFEEPLFAKATFSTDFGYGDGRKNLEYKGLGYNISTYRIQTAESKKLISVNMYLFNNKILSKDREIKDVIIDNVNIENSIGNIAKTKRMVIVKVNNTTLSVMDVEKQEDLYVVTIPKGENLNFKQGQEILIHYNGNIIYTFPRQIVNVGKIEIIQEVSEIEIPTDVLRYFYNDKDKVKVSIDELTDIGIAITITDTNNLPYEYDTNGNLYCTYKLSEDVMTSQNVQAVGNLISSNAEEIIKEIKIEELTQNENIEANETITKMSYTWAEAGSKLKKGEYQFVVSTANWSHFSIRVNFQVDDSGNIIYDSISL